MTRQRCSFQGTALEESVGGSSHHVPGMESSTSTRSPEWRAAGDAGVDLRERSWVPGHSVIRDGSKQAGQQSETVPHNFHQE